MANDTNISGAEGRLDRRIDIQAADPTKSAFFWLSAFFVVYCARPGDWLPGAAYVPLAKITAILAIWGLFNSMGRTKRTMKDMPKEARLLLTMIILLIIGAFLSPVWKGGAVSSSVEFSKIYIAWTLVFLLITSFERLRRIIFIQAASVLVACAAALIKGHGVERLNGVLGGFYSNPNDLAFAVVLALPFALLFMVTAKNIFFRVFWLAGILTMLAVIFLTASRAGFIDLMISGSVTLYFFGIKGKRPSLLTGAALAAILIASTVGGKLYNRFEAISGETATEKSAYGSYEDRKFLMVRAVEAIETYPIFGIGAHNFATYSGIWRDVHMTYLQVCSEGGIPVLVLYLWFFWLGFRNLRILLKTKNLDTETSLFVWALTSSLVGFVVGALFAPEAYQYFPYFSVAFSATLLQTFKEREQEKGGGTVAPPPKKLRHFLEVYDHGRTNAVSPIR